MYRDAVKKLRAYLKEDHYGLAKDASRESVAKLAEELQESTLPH